MTSTEPTSPPPPSTITEQENQQQPPSQETLEQIQQENQNKNQNAPRPHRPRKPILTHHCRFCSHLLLATTRDISRLRRRRDPAQDRALILPISRGSSSDVDSESESESESDDDGKNKGRETDYTILLSTLLPDRKQTIIRRVDGFEKRLLLRCGRCRVVIGYFLDEVHFKKGEDERTGGGDGESRKDGEREEGGKGDDEGKVVYLLPGALVRTEELDVDAEDVELKLESDREWRGWLKGER